MCIYVFVLITFTYIYNYIYIYVLIACIYIYVYVYICICIYLFPCIHRKAIGLPRKATTITIGSTHMYKILMEHIYIYIPMIIYIHFFFTQLYLYIHINVHTYMHAYIHTYIRTYMHICIHPYMYTHTYIYIHIFPQTVWPHLHWEHLTVGAKARCLIEVVSGASGLFSGKFPHKNGSCEMSMCMSTAQARTKRVSRKLASGIFPVNFDKMDLVTCPCACRLRKLAQSVLPGLGLGLPPQHHPPQHHHHHHHHHPNHHHHHHYRPHHHPQHQHHHQQHHHHHQHHHQPTVINIIINMIMHYPGDYPLITPPALFGVSSGMISFIYVCLHRVTSIYIYWHTCPYTDVTYAVIHTYIHPSIHPSIHPYIHTYIYIYIKYIYI